MDLSSALHFIEESWEIDGLFGLIRYGEFDPELGEELIEALQVIKQHKNDIDPNLYQDLWYIPIHLYRNQEHIAQDQSESIDEFQSFIEDVVEIVSETIGSPMYGYMHGYKEEKPPQLSAEAYYAFWDVFEKLDHLETVTAEVEARVDRMGIAKNFNDISIELGDYASKVHEDFIQSLPLVTISKCPFSHQRVQVPLDQRSLAGLHRSLALIRSYYHGVSAWSNLVGVRNAVVSLMSLNLNQNSLDDLPKELFPLGSFDNRPRILTWPLNHPHAKAIISKVAVGRYGEDEPSEAYTLYFLCYFVDRSKNIPDSYFKAGEFISPQLMGPDARYETGLEKWRDKGQLLVYDSERDQLSDDLSQLNLLAEEDAGYFRILPSSEIDGPHPYPNESYHTNTR